MSDCLSGEDEYYFWPQCKINGQYRDVRDNTTCNNVFLCYQGSYKYVELEQLCDQREDCGEEKSVCKAARLTNPYFVSPITYQGTTYISYCIPGMGSIELLADTCNEDIFESPDYPVLGAVASVTLMTPNKLFDCGHVFGKLSVYLSCTDRCINTTCPLTSIKHDTCSATHANRVFAMAKERYMTSVIKYREKYHSNLFLCTNDNCVSYDKVCNLIDDCGDNSDESNCTNHFQCNTTKMFIEPTKKCNGIIDCFDYSDECNLECGKQILSNFVFKVVAWVLGGTSVIFNLCILWKDVAHSWTGNKAARCNKILKMMINIGDFMTGLYLLLLAITDGFLIGDSYCRNQLTWLTSVHCAGLGIISTFGANLSLFSMAYLSLFRAQTVTNTGYDFTNIYKFQNVISIMIIIVASFAIAYIPLMEVFEDFFVNGMIYDKNVRLFNAAANKQEHSSVLNAYYGKINKQKLSWREIKRLMHLMFTNDHGELNRKKVHFYGNEGVCVFKYFVQNSDPQKHFVWAILSTNFLSFVVILISYGVIHMKAKRTNIAVRNMLAGSKTKNPDQSTMDRLLRNITRIIVTDFLCWIPFILICVLHSMEVLDATFLYSYSSILILPINSVINPLLYNDLITKTMLKIRHTFRLLTWQKNIVRLTKAPEIYVLQIRRPP